MRHVVECGLCLISFDIVELGEFVDPRDVVLITVSKNE